MKNTRLTQEIGRRSMTKGGASYRSLTRDFDLRISLWNYEHYRKINFRFIPPIEDILARVRAEGFGIELWPYWRGVEERENFYQPRYWPWLKRITAGMKVSMHNRFTPTKGWRALKTQIDTAAAIGADVLVMHPHELLAVNPQQRVPDCAYAARAVAYGLQQDVTLALENGGLELLQQAAREIPELSLCVDTGHVYLESRTLPEYLRAFGDRIRHFHFQDVIYLADEKRLTDHLTLGSGIPKRDWKYTFDFIRERKRRISIAFEIRPPCPILTARQSLAFLSSL
ncbi:sugar phosphate isomerase/epimerase [bacterium]|nr:sugar phosphate isomerase/epimerase [bacterium]